MHAATIAYFSRKCMRIGILVQNVSFAGSMADDGLSGHCSSVPASTPSVCNSRDSVLIPITFGENGQPIGQEAAQLSSLIGRLVKTYVPIVYVVWTDVPNETTEKIWKEVSGTYTIDPWWKVIQTMMQLRRSLVVMTKDVYSA
ncbi:hypothetical protein AAC387_Pa05g1836 [Persea americana]